MCLGARLRDLISGESWEVKAKVVVNATGPFADGVRSMVEPGAKPLVAGTPPSIPWFYFLCS